MATVQDFYNYANRTNEELLHTKVSSVVQCPNNVVMDIDLGPSGIILSFAGRGFSFVTCWNISFGGIEGRRRLADSVLLKANLNRTNSYYHNNSLARAVLLSADDESVENFILRCVKHFTDCLQKPESRGNVKAYLDSQKIEWLWKRPSSVNMVKVGDEYFIPETDNRFVKVYKDEDEFEWRERSNISADEIVSLSSRFWFKSALVPIYQNALPFTQISRYVRPSEADRYEFIIMDGERRYIEVRRATSRLEEYPIHQYNTRIESLIPADKLFLKSKNDLYEKRSQEETPFLGWELEACCSGNLSEAAKAFKAYMPFELMCKSDSSISPAGFEIVSIPATLDHWKESNLHETLNSMRVAPHSMRSYSHSSCGFHVHVSRSALSVLDLQKMERFVHNPDNRAFLTSVAGRGSNTYQAYDDKLFKDRKSLSLVSGSTISSSETIDGIAYFSGYSDSLAATREYISSEPVVYDRLRGFISNYVQYVSISETLNRLTGSLLRYSIQQIFDGCVSAPYASNLCLAYSEIGSSFETSSPMVRCKREAEKLIGLISHASDHFAYLLHLLNINWSTVKTVTEDPRNTTQNTEQDTTTPEWKLKKCKSSLPAGRKNNYNNCMRLSSGPVGKAVIGRYDVLNTRNQNTVEFRLFKGTMNPTSVMRYLEFADALVRFVPHTSAKDEGVSYKEFVKWLVSDGFNITRYEHLVSFLKDAGWIEKKSVRRRSLPKVESVDNKVAGLVAVKPKGFSDNKSTPIGSFNTENVPPNMAAAAYDPDEEESEEPEGEEVCEECHNYYDYCTC